MARVFRQLYYHVVWATRNREPVLTPSLRALLLETIQEKCRTLGCRLHAVNAVEEHVHVALEIPPSLAVGAVVGQLKGASSHHLNARTAAAIYWQEGYGVVTFRKGDLPKVIAYVEAQQERHRAQNLSPMLETCEDPTNRRPTTNRNRMGRALRTVGC